MPFNQNGNFKSSPSIATKLKRSLSNSANRILEGFMKCKGNWFYVFAYMFFKFRRLDKDCPFMIITSMPSYISMPVSINKFKLLYKLIFSPQLGNLFFTLIKALRICLPYLLQLIQVYFRNIRGRDVSSTIRAATLILKSWLSTW